MVVTIRRLNELGDMLQQLELDDAKTEIEEAVRNGCIPVINGMAVAPSKVQEDDEVILYRTGEGG